MMQTVDELDRVPMARSTFADAGSRSPLPDIPHEVTSRVTVWEGRAFAVESRTVTIDGKPGIRRDVVRHAPVVYILAHDRATDRYLVEREYRAGVDRTCYGLPAGFIDRGEAPERAALRELREETGVEPVDGTEPEPTGVLASSQGFTDEVAHTYRIELDGWRQAGTSFDGDEDVRSGWVPFHVLESLMDRGELNGATAVAMLMREKIRRAGLWSVTERAGKRLPVDGPDRADA